MSKEELVIQATKDIVVAVVTEKKIDKNVLLPLIKEVANTLSEAYDDCQK